MIRALERALRLRAIVEQYNSLMDGYEPLTHLGQRLIDLRRNMLAHGIPLLTLDEINLELERVR